VSPLNFNYQVALKSGLKSLQEGRLRQAEQHFKFLVDKFPGAEGGYRGLAKVYFEQEDRAGSLRVLREGAAALARSGERSAAIGLLREAVALDPLDLATHRRLAAALALAGDSDAAVMEYQRFVRAAFESGDGERARLEAAYAIGQLRDVPAARDLARWTDGGAPQPVRPVADAPAPAGWSAPAPAASKWASSAPLADPWSTPAPRPPQVGAPSTREEDRWSAHSDTAAAWAAAVSQPAAPAESTPAATTRAWSAPAEPTPATTAPPETAAARTPPPPPPVASVADGSFAGADSAVVEAAAARYLATHDPRAAGAALEAARRYIKDGRNDAASDLLLQLIASGVADHDAQRLLVDVVRLLPGKRDVVRTKCQLLVQALLLDGRADLAAEVEALINRE
jgi:thioredoxin-like negative regulator of GroEL